MLFDALKIPGFRTLNPKEKYDDTNENCRNGRTTPELLSFFSYRRVHDGETTVATLMDSIPMDVNGYSGLCAVGFWMHPAAVFEFCQYFKLSYPVEEIKRFEKSEIRRKQKDGASRDKGGSMPARTSRALIKQKIELIKQKIEEIVPQVFSASHSAINTARLRALWGYLIWELKLRRARLAGLTFPKLFE